MSMTDRSDSTEAVLLSRGPAIISLMKSWSSGSSRPCCSITGFSFSTRRSNISQEAVSCCKIHRLEFNVYIITHCSSSKSLSLLKHDRLLCVFPLSLPQFLSIYNYILICLCWGTAAFLGMLWPLLTDLQLVIFTVCLS